MIYAQLLLLSLLVLGLGQCGRPGGQSTESPPVPPREAASRPAPEAASCEFSSFHPVTLPGLGGWQGPAISKPQPTYPPEAKARGIEGIVKIKVLLNARGEVERACVLEGDETLGKAAREAALKSNFGPIWGKRIAEAGSSYGEGVIRYWFVPR